MPAAKDARILGQGLDDVVDRLGLAPGFGILVLDVHAAPAHEPDP